MLPLPRLVPPMFPSPEVADVTAAQVRVALVATVQVEAADVPKTQVDAREGGRRRGTPQQARHTSQRPLPRHQLRSHRRRPGVITGHRGHISSPHLLVLTLHGRNRRRVLPEQIRHHQPHHRRTIGRHQQRINRRRPRRLKRSRHRLRLRSRTTPAPVHNVEQITAAEKCVTSCP